MDRGPVKDELPLALFPELTRDGRCRECGAHWNFCQDCGRWWTGRHICDDDEITDLRPPYG
jgi:hypothetical protein